VFVVEDKDWAISMPKSRVTDVEYGPRRADGFEMPGHRADHDDVLAVYDAVEEAVERARAGNGPTPLEVQVHRRMCHFMGDAKAYRLDADKERAEKQDLVPYSRPLEDEVAPGVEDIEAAVRATR
jgi:pyruvate dehydrogenase E1 component alpha subunit